MAIRVVRVIGRMNVGGPARQVVVLERSLPQLGYESSLVVGTVDDGEADHLVAHAPDIAATSVPGLGRAVRPSDDFRAFRDLVRILRAHRPHIVHTHTAKAGVLGRLAAWTCGVPATVHTFHGHLLQGYFSRPVTQAVVTAERVLARRTTRLVAVGERVRDELVDARIGTREQYSVVAPGIEEMRIPSQAAARRVLDLPMTSRVVAFCGRLTGIKRPDRVIDVADVVCRSLPDVVFVVAGGGELLSALQQRAEPWRDRVRFLGWRDDIENVYSAADVVLLTSDNEGMPVSLIEASAAGRPCVTTRVGSAPEVVLHGRTGLVVATEIGALSEAVISLLEMPDLRGTMGEAAKVHAHSHFSASRLVSDTDELYRSLATNSTTGSQ